MPSVRVKRSYATISENQDEAGDYFSARPTLGPRSRSAQLVGPSTPGALSLNEQSVGNVEKTPTSPRKRSHTVSGPGPSTETMPKRLSRPPSRVRQHIMSTSRNPVSPVEENLRAPETFMDHLRRSISSHSHSRRSEMISLEGPAENILIPADPGHEPGRVGSALSSHREAIEDPFEEHHHDDIVEHLDVIDPQIATVSTLTNAANAIVIPPLPFYNRKPVVVLPEIPRDPNSDAEDGRQNEDNLDRHIEDVLTKRQQFKRIMRGVWSFMKTPMGIVVSIYGFLVVFWGSALVLFLVKWIDVHNEITQGFWVELCQQILCGLFTATSIGLIPFRALDTYRITKIWYYKRRITKLRRMANLPELYDPDDLPDPAYDVNYVHVLTQKEQDELHYQQHKFAQSQTWYRPHGTQTHRAFPINIALWICVCNDLNSFFQALLSACMWSMDRYQRPDWTTATTLPLAFVSGIIAGVLIWWGGRKTRRHQQVEERLRTALALDSPNPNNANNAETNTNQDPSIPAVVVEKPAESTSSPEDARLQTAAVRTEGEGEVEENERGGSSSSNSLGPEIHVEDFASAAPTDERTTESGSFFTDENDEERRREESDTRERKESVVSASVPIADSMTVPRAEELHGADDLQTPSNPASRSRSRLHLHS
ncbi:hypothetical protein K474DRAFT_1703572 [Panus rudis PR-1116 ss-1]|nr:hypothetical protein K474DRAFT_1703572 [Panus rudis PR-1116 ss-1]